MKDYCIFGPIPSRRLGISLGIDLVPYKTCSMDCVYCECGKTTCLTAERKEYFPTDRAVTQISAALEKHPKIDYVTFSGVGEPTLHSGIGQIIAHIKKNYPELKVCLLTNSSLLDSPGLIEEIAPADLIIPSLDGSNEEEFIAMNRPVEGISFENVVNAIVKLKRQVRSEIWLEIFIRKGVNDSLASAKRFRNLVQRIAPDKVQLNTLDRPGTDPDVEIPFPETMNMLCSEISVAAPVECVGGSLGRNQYRRKISPEHGLDERNWIILEALKKHPCTAAELAALIDVPEPRIYTHMLRMEKAGFAIRHTDNEQLFYSAAPSK